MRRRRLWLVIGAGVLFAMPHVARAQAKDPLAFVAEVTGEAYLVRIGEHREIAVVGSQLSRDEVLQVDKGTAVLIYLSGRSVTVTAGKTHKVQEEGSKPSALMGRIMTTLGEMAGPQDEAEQPAVHGMARDLAGVSGALPANARVSHRDFAFSWDAVEGIDEYEFILKSPTGEVLIRKTVKGTQLIAEGLEPGRRYTWNVRETQSLLARSSGENWVEIASAEEAQELGRSFQDLKAHYRGEPRTLLQAAVFYQQGYYYEAERLLVELQGRRALSPVEQNMLRQTYLKMGRWERLPRPEKGE